MRQPLPLLFVLTAAAPLCSTNLMRHDGPRMYKSLQETAQLFLKAPEPQHILPPAEPEDTPPPETIPEPRKPHFRFDARENSMGVVFTTDDEEVLHLWIPIGRKLHTRDSPMLPIHPHTARVTTMINTSPSLADPEQLDRIQCNLWTYYPRPLGRGKSRPEKWKVSFSKEDGLVQFATRSGSERFWLGGKEVESYECL